MLATSSTQRLVIQAQGQEGSNQKSTAVWGAGRHGVGHARPVDIPRRRDGRVARRRRVGPRVHATTSTTMERACPERTSPESKPRSAQRIVDVQSYEVALDLTRGAETFGSTTTVRFTATPGASTFIDAITRTVHSVTLNGTGSTPPRSTTACASSSTTCRRERARRRRRRDVHEHRRGPAPLRRPGRRRGLPVLASSRCPTPAACSRCSSSPTSRRRSSFTVTAPARWQVVSNSPTPEPVVDGDGAAPGRSSPPPHLELHHGASSPARTTSCAAS